MPTVKELRAECTIRGITGYSRLNKTGLLQQLQLDKDMKAIDELAADFTGTLGKFEIKNKSKFGIHVAKKDNMVDSITYAIKTLNLSSIQIFTHGPRNQHASKMDYDAVKAASTVNLYIHSSYLTNPWNGKASIFTHTIDQFRAADKLGALGVVLHIPKLSAARVAETTHIIVNRLIAEGISVKVILEMKAVKSGDLSYESPEKIDALISELKSKGLTPQNTVICIDTAHIYAGKAQIRTYTEGNAFLKALKYPEWIGLIHLNGNEYDAKKRAGDKHAVPFDKNDKIWNGVPYAESGCRSFVDWATEKNIDCILEIKDYHTYNDVQVFIELI